MSLDKTSDISCDLVGSTENQQPNELQSIDHPAVREGTPSCTSFVKFPEDVCSAAKVYLAKGLSPIPLPHQSKQAIIVGWQQLKVTIQTINDYFPAKDPHNIGILNGAPSGNVVDVDLDCPEARQLADQFLPATGWIFGRQSARRSHRIYRADGSQHTSQVKYSDITGAVLLELRTTGTQTVFPPSTHPSGEQITWDTFDDLAGIALSDLQKAASELAVIALLARHWPGKGTRQETYMALIGGLVRAGYLPEQVEQFVESLALATGDEESKKRLQLVEQTVSKLTEGTNITGWPKLEELLGEKGRELIQRIHKWLGLNQSSQTSRPKRKIRHFKPFPLGVLPETIKEFVIQAAKSIGSDPTMVVLPALAAAASAIGNTRVIQLKKGWLEPSSLWTVIVCDSGALKSPAMQAAVSPLWKRQRQLFAKFKEDITKYQEEIKAGKDKKCNPTSTPDEPVFRRVVVSDITIEKLAEILEDNPRGLLLSRDELAAWIGSFTRYKNKGAVSDVPTWLELHRAGSFTYDRKTGDRKTIFVDRGVVSVTGSGQPGVLAQGFSTELFEAGLVARLLMAMPPKQARIWTEDEIDSDVAKAYEDLLCKLLDLDFDSGQEENQPHILQLSSEAKNSWIKYYNSWGQVQLATEGELAAAFSKIEGYAARLALVHHVVSRVSSGQDDLVPIGKESIEAGIAISTWFAEESDRIYSTLSESKNDTNIRRLVEWVTSQGGKTTVKQLQKSNGRKYPTSEAAAQALRELENSGYGFWENRPSDHQGGRPTRDFMLYKANDETDETPSDNTDHEDDASGLAITPSTPPNPPNGVSGTRPKCPVTSVSPDGGGAESSISTPVVRDEETVARVSSDTTSYTLINEASGLDRVIASLSNSWKVGLDIETTGLDPRSDRIRLLSLACSFPNDGVTTYIIDCFALDPSTLWDVLSKKELIIHNAAFDLSFLARIGFVSDNSVNDTMLLAQLLNAGTGKKATLRDCCRDWLSLTVEKQEQKSDWSGQLTVSQLNYAAKDAAILIPLQRVLYAKIHEAGLIEAARIEHRCIPAVLWMAGHGVPLNKNSWFKLAADATDETDQLREELNQKAPPKPGKSSSNWNWNSSQQVKQALAQAGCLVTDTKDETLALTEHPLAQLIRNYRLANKRASTYGFKWIDQHVSADGRIYPSWKQIGTVTGRMSCRQPNMQQLPRGTYRCCVEAPAGRTLVKADYSQIEIRIAAKVSEDSVLLKAYQDGEDLHIRTAQTVLGIKNVSPGHRQLAKAINFGLLFGMGTKGFQQYAKSEYKVDLTMDQANQYRDAFFRTYPGLETWQIRTRSRRAVQTRTLSGRRRLLDAKTRDTERLNTPVQGTGADGLKLALALLWERRDQVPGAFPVLAVHDELVVECDIDQAADVAGWLKEAMEEAMHELIRPVPVVVEVQIGKTWNGDLADETTHESLAADQPNIRRLDSERTMI